MRTTLEKNTQIATQGLFKPSKQIESEIAGEGPSTIRFEDNFGVNKAPGVQSKVTLDALLGTYKKNGAPRYEQESMYLNIRRLKDGSIRVEERKTPDGPGSSAWVFRNINGEADVSTFGKFEGQGNGTLEERHTFDNGKLARTRVKHESWGWEAIFGATPVKYIEKRTFELDGNTLRSAYTRDFFHRRYGIFGPFDKPFTAKMGNTLSLHDEYTKIG